MGPEFHRVVSLRVTVSGSLVRLCRRWLLEAVLLVGSQRRLASDPTAILTP